MLYKSSVVRVLVLGVGTSNARRRSLRRLLGFACALVMGREVLASTFGVGGGGRGRA